MTSCLLAMITMILIQSWTTSIISISLMIYFSQVMFILL